jgi:hypothetical protein
MVERRWTIRLDYFAKLRDNSIDSVCFIEIRNQRLSFRLSASLYMFHGLELAMELGR